MAMSMVRDLWTTILLHEQQASDFRRLFVLCTVPDRLTALLSRFCTLRARCNPRFINTNAVGLVLNSTFSKYKHQRFFLRKAPFSLFANLSSESLTLMLYATKDIDAEADRHLGEEDDHGMRRFGCVDHTSIEWYPLRFKWALSDLKETSDTTCWIAHRSYIMTEMRTN